MPFTDDFTGSDGQKLEDRAGWTLVQDGGYFAEIQSNGLRYQVSNATDHTIYACTDQGSADQYTQATLTSALEPNFDVYYCINLVDDRNYIGWRLYGTGGAGLRLTRYVAGVKTDLVTFQGVANNTYKVERDGSTVRIYENDVQKGADQTVTDHQTETTQGIIQEGVEPNAQITDFEAGALGGGGTTHDTTADHSVVSVESTTASAVQQHLLSGSQSLVAVLSNSPDVVQEHQLSGRDSSGSVESTFGDVSQSHNLTAFATTILSASTAAAAQQIHSLAGLSSTVAVQSSIGNLATGLVLTALASRVDGESTTGGASQTHALTGAHSRVDSDALTAALQQIHQLTGAGSSVPAESTVADVATDLVLTAIHSVIGAESTAGDAEQAHVLTALQSVVNSESSMGDWLSSVVPDFDNIVLTSKTPKIALRSLTARITLTSKTVH